MRAFIRSIFLQQNICSKKFKITLLEPVGYMFNFPLRNSSTPKFYLFDKVHKTIEFFEMDSPIFSSLLYIILTDTKSIAGRLNIKKSTAKQFCLKNVVRILVFQHKCMFSFVPPTLIYIVEWCKPLREKITLHLKTIILYANSTIIVHLKSYGFYPILVFR